MSWTTLTFSARVRNTCDRMARTWPTAWAFLRSTDKRWWMAVAQSSTHTASQNWLMNSVCCCVFNWERKGEGARERWLATPSFRVTQERMNDYLRSCWGVQGVPPSPAAFPKTADHRLLVLRPFFYYPCSCRPAPRRIKNKLYITTWQCFMCSH